jgi:hypothetical protein
MSKIPPLVFLLLVCVFANSCDTERNLDPANTFTKVYGIQGDQVAVDMARAVDGSVYLLGNHVTTDLGAENFKPYLVRADENGISVWEVSIEGLGNSKAKDIEIAENGNLLIVGDTDLRGDKNFFILEVDPSNGSELRRIIDGFDTSTESVESITQISDGYLVSGSTTNVKPGGGALDGFVFRYRMDFTSYGSVWADRYGTTATDLVLKTLQMGPNLFYMFGHSNQQDNLDLVSDFNFWIFPVENTGQPAGSPYTPGRARTNELLSSVVPIAGTNSFLLTGTTEDGGVLELYTVKIRGNIETIENPDDLIQQEKVLTSFGFSTDASTKAIGYSSATGFYVVSSQNSDGNEDIYFSKLDSRLIPEEQSDGLRFGGVGADKAAAFSELPDGHLLILGTMVLGEVNGQRKVVLLKVNSRGKFD